MNKEARRRKKEEGGRKKDDEMKKEEKGRRKQESLGRLDEHAVFPVYAQSLLQPTLGISPLLR
mgnify:FL=1